MEKVRESIQHHLHPHALLLNHEEQSDEIQEACCSACLESLSFGRSFSCGESSCKFHLHKKCAQAPRRINQSPFHNHPYMFIKLSTSYLCDLCGENRPMFIYRCSSCSFCLDFKCALLLHNIGENFRKIKHFAHQHQLTFFENIPKDELERAECYWCRKPLADDPLYACLQCTFYLHKKCAKLPTQLLHPFHRKHPTELLGGHLFCKVCKKENWGFFLHCSPCHLAFHIKCAWPPPIIEDRPHHNHPFHRLFRSEHFTCDACGTEGNYVSYICLTCNIQVHQNCTALPHIIKTTRHHHYIIHKYFFQKTEFADENQECQICFKQIKTEYGNYCCLKQDCKFVAHVKCAMERGMYDVIEQANVEDEESSENSAMNFSITRVIERNEHGEDTKIEHFSHEHYLTLGNKIKEDDDDKRCCDGCMLSISTPFYFCSQSQCEFLLHKACAELPRKMRLWFHRPFTSLNLVDLFYCLQCNRYGSGFVYKSDRNSYFTVCLRCARIPHTLTVTSHGHSLFFNLWDHGDKHSLFFDFNFSGKCDACGSPCDGAFKCKDCYLALDFACITLPETIRHKCDEHNLARAFHGENEDPKQCYCDVCEEERDPNYWFYHCTICDNSTHPGCVLGEFSFVKMGVNVPCWFYYNPHRHPLIFAKKNYEICSRCGKPCQDEVALECKHCTDNNYVIHFRCG